MVQERKNRYMAYRVEKALIMQRDKSTAAAAAYLANYGVPMHVSVRVLTTPNKRPLGQYPGGDMWFDVVRNAGMTYGG